MKHVENVDSTASYQMASHIIRIFEVEPQRLGYTLVYLPYCKYLLKSCDKKISPKTVSEGGAG